MTKLVNRAKMTTATTGTGTITLGSAVDGYQTFSDAGIVNSDVVRYTIEDGDAWEIGTGTYSSGTLTRVLDESSTGSLLNLSGDAVVYVTAAGEDIQQPPSEGPFVDGDKTKLDGIEAGADVTDTANVTAAGALMDSEVTNLAQVKAFDSADYATAAQGSLADSAVQPGDNPSFGSVTVSGTVDGRDIAADGSKLDGIETGATNYGDSDVDTHLNTSTASASEVLSWTGTDYDWIVAGGGVGSVNTQIFTSSGTYTPTAGTAFIEVIVVGGGGSGGGTFGGVSGGGGVVTSGGAGGNTLIATVDISDVGSSATVTVGAGGSGDGYASSDGGDSSFVGSTVNLTALGGTKGIDQGFPPSTDDEWYISGAVQPPSQTPPAGVTLTLGGQGESGIISSNRSATQDFFRGGYGGDTPFGRGGRSGLSESTSTSYLTGGEDGIGYGSGGGGLVWRSDIDGLNALSAGANGIVIVKEYIA